jgi:hypothetical protein
MAGQGCKQTQQPVTAEYAEYAENRRPAGGGGLRIFLKDPGVPAVEGRQPETATLNKDSNAQPQ